jgi:hypothetical protein
MDVVTAVTIGLKVLIFLQELEKNRLTNTTVAEGRAKRLLGASEPEAKDIACLASQLDDDFLRGILSSVGGLLNIFSILQEKK